MASKTLLVAACLLTLAVAAPVADAEPPEPYCYEIYNEYHVGPVTVIQRSSCDYEVYAFGEPIIG